MGESEDIKKIIFTKIAMAINAKGLKTNNPASLELSLRKSGDFTKDELDLIFGVRPQAYYDELEYQRRKKLGLIFEEEQDKKGNLYAKAQEDKKQKELDKMIREAGG